MKDNGVRLNYKEVFGLVPTEIKEKPEYFMTQAQYSIANLHINKSAYMTAYNYYNGIFNAKDYATYTNNFGVGNPCDIKFIPLMRKYIQFLLGVSQSRDVTFKVSYNSQEMINKNLEQKKNRLLQELQQMFVKQYNNPQTDVFKETEIKRVNEFIKNRFQTDIELTCADILHYIQHHQYIDFKSKFSLIEQDLYVLGEGAYRINYDKDIHNFPILEVVNPINLFYRKNLNNIYLNTCERIVYRYFDSPENIIADYGDEMTDEEINDVYRYVGLSGANAYSSEYLFLRDTINAINPDNAQYFERSRNLVQCYHVEWLADEEIEIDGEKRYIQNRYSCRRIGSNIYVDMKKDENAVRNTHEPYKTKLSYNGIAITDRNSLPYSLILKTRDLQDKYNIYHYKRDVIVSLAGAKGVYIDQALIPKNAALDEAQRLNNYQGLLRQGIALIDSSDEAFENRPALNTIFNGYDLSLDENTVNAYNNLIRSVEEDASKITGVPLQALGQIEQRDAVTNVKTGIQQSLIVNKVYFTLIDKLKQSCLTDFVNCCSNVFKKGMKFSITDEGLERIFVIKDDINFEDLSVFIEDSSEQVMQMAEIKSLVIELIKARQITADLAIKLTSCKSLTEANLIVRNAVAENTNQQLQQLQQQLEELTKQNEMLNKQNQQFNKNQENIKQKELSLKEKEMNDKMSLEKEKINNDKTFKTKALEIKEQQLKAEVLQLADNNNKNDEILNI